MWRKRASPARLEPQSQRGLWAGVSASSPLCRVVGAAQSPGSSEDGSRGPGQGKAGCDSTIPGACAEHCMHCPAHPEALGDNADVPPPLGTWNHISERADCPTSRSACHCPSASPHPHSRGGGYTLYRA